MTHRAFEFVLTTCLALCVLSPGGLLNASPTEPKVVIVSSGSSNAYVETVRALTDNLHKNGVSSQDVVSFTVDEWKGRVGTDHEPHPRLLVGLGTEAANLLASQRAPVPVLNALIPLSSFHRVLQQHQRQLSSQFAVLHLDQPWRRQLALIRLVFGQSKSIGVLWGPSSVAEAPALNQQANIDHLTIVNVEVKPESSIFLPLTWVLSKSDLLLAVPDPQVYNPNNIQNILLSTIRARKPMMGFSPAYVRAGAMIGLYVTPTQVGQQAASLVKNALNGTPFPHHPIPSDDFEVEVNASVSRAFGLTLDPERLREAVRRLER